MKELRPAGNGLINQFVNNTEVVNKIIPFFEIVSSGDLEAVPEEEFVYQWSEDTPQDKLRIKAEVISKYKKYFEEIKIKQNEKYISLTSKQKNKIASSDRFKEIYKYYFKKSVPKSGEAIDSLFEKFNSIFKAYTIAIRSYLISSNPTERELTKDITLRLKNEIFLINEGFPENIVEKFDVYSREELYKKIEIGRFEAAENFEIYNLKVKRTSDLANTTADLQKMTRELTQKAVEDKMKIDDEKTSIFAIIIGTLKKGGTSTETIKTKDGKPIVQIRFLDTKTLWDNKNNIAQKTFNVMVKLLLSTLVYLKDIILNIRLDEYNGFNNRLQYGPFITALISTLFVGSYTDLSAGVAKGIDRGTVAGYISTESGVSSTIKNVDNIFRNNADDGNSSDKNVKDFFDGLKGNIDLNITNYTTDVKDIFKVSLSVINTRLADIAQNIVDNSTIKPPNANDKLRGIINRNIDNISYPMIAKILERKDVISKDNLDTIFDGDINLSAIANALSENIEQGTEDLLISMLEKDYKENIKNSNDPLQTLRETIVDNPFVNCLGIIK